MVIYYNKYLDVAVTLQQRHCHLKNLTIAVTLIIVWKFGPNCDVISTLLSCLKLVIIYSKYLTFVELCHKNPITPVKGGSIKDFTLFWKTKSSKKCACALFYDLIFRYTTDIFQNKKKLHIDLKKKKWVKNWPDYHTNIMSGDQSISQRKFSVLFRKICCEQSKFYLVCDSYPRTGCLDFSMA